MKAFSENGPEACVDGATSYVDTRDCLMPDEVAATGNKSAVSGMGIGYNSNMREVRGYTR